MSIVMHTCSNENAEEREAYAYVLHLHEEDSPLYPLKFYTQEQLDGIIAEHEVVTSIRSHDVVDEEHAMFTTNIEFPFDHLINVTIYGGYCMWTVQVLDSNDELRQYMLPYFHVKEMRTEPFIKAQYVVGVGVFVQVSCCKYIKFC